MCGSCRKNDRCHSEKYDSCRKRYERTDCCDPCPKTCAPACPPAGGTSVSFDALKALIISYLLNALGASGTTVDLDALATNLGTTLNTGVTAAINMIPNVNQSTSQLITQIGTVLSSYNATLTTAEAGVADAGNELAQALALMNSILPLFSLYNITPPPQPFCQPCYKTCCY
jgi:hypothetical protein